MKVFHLLKFNDFVSPSKIFLSVMPTYTSFFNFTRKIWGVGQKQ